jgi:hypothetical protein
VDNIADCENEPAPQPGQRVVCRDPFEPQQCMAVTPTDAQPLYGIVFETGLVCTVPRARGCNGRGEQKHETGLVCKVPRASSSNGRGEQKRAPLSRPCLASESNLDLFLPVWREARGCGP